MKQKTPTDAVDALLLIGPGCPHCAALQEILGKLVKAGDIGQLTIVNVAKHPESAQQFNVRSVPWTKIGLFELEGARTEGEIKLWLQRLNSDEGMQAYVDELLSSGKLDKVIQLVKTAPQQLQVLIALIADPDLNMKVQLGISAVFEELQGSELLQDIVDDLGTLAGNEQAKVRADAAHFLGLSESRKAIPYLEKLSTDENDDVKEVAMEAQDELGMLLNL